MHKIGQSGRLLGRLLGPLLKTGLLLFGNVWKPLAKRVLKPLGLTAAAPVTDVGIRKKMFESSTRTLIIFNREMNVIMKIVKSLQESDVLINQTIKNEARE